MYPRLSCVLYQQILGLNKAVILTDGLQLRRRSPKKIFRPRSPIFSKGAITNKATKPQVGREANFRGFIFPEMESDHNFLMKEMYLLPLKLRNFRFETLKRKLSKMSTSSGLIDASKGCTADEPINAKPIIPKATEKHTEEKVQTKTEDDTCNQYEDLTSDKKSMRNLETNRRFKWISVIACVISTAALLLSVLIMFGKIGHGCGCSEKEGQFYSSSETINSLVLSSGFECCCQLLSIAVGSCRMLSGCCQVAVGCCQLLSVVKIDVSTN